MENKIAIEYPEDNLYLKYLTQNNPQPTYLYLGEGKLWAAYDGNIGGGMSFDVFHGKIRRYRLPSPALTKDSIHEIMDEIMPLAQQVWDGMEVYWDGSNWRGRLSEKASEVEEKIDQLLHDWITDDHDQCLQIWDACDYYQDSHDEVIELVKAGKTDTEIAEWIEADAHEQVDILTNVDGYIEWIKDKISEEDDD